jgi:GlcNAc-P-P-Und epimerase
MFNHMKIAITGSTGFIGSNLARYLTSAGHQVFASDIRSSIEIPSGLDFEQVDLLDQLALTGWVKRIEPDVLFHLGARTDLIGRSASDYAANTKGVENIILACRGSRSLRRVLFASSRMVCRIDHQPAHYNDYCPPNAYGESKVVGERIVKSTDAGFQWVLFRPTSIWGPGFGIPYRNFFDQIRKKRYFHPGGYRPKKSFGYIGNTIFQLSKLIDAPAGLVNHKCFYLGDFEPLCVNDWADTIHQMFGLSGHIKTVPIPLLRVAGCVGNVINQAMGKDVAPLTTFRLNNLISDMVYPQLEELRAATGELPFSWREGTKQTVDWLCKDNL